jgi:hypothetical protein
LIVKKALALTALSASLLATFPVHAAPAAAATTPAAAAAPAAAVKPAKAAKTPSDLFEALSAAGKEFKTVFGGGKGNPIPKLDKLAAYQVSDATRAKLAKVFGNTQPMTITKSDTADGMLSYLMAVPAHSFTDANAVTVAWTELALRILVDKTGRSMSSTGKWESISVSDKDMVLTVKDMSLESNQRRNAQDTWLGTAQGRVASIAVTPVDPAKGTAMEMEEMVVAVATTQRGAGIDLAYDTRIKAIKVAGEQMDDMRFVMRATNIDLQAWEKLSERFEAAERPDMSKAQQAEMANGIFKAFGKNIAARGTALEIDELSAGFHGHRAVIKGRIALAKSTEADFKSMAAVGKKVVARLNVRVPVALVNEVAKVIMIKEAEKKGETMTADAIEQTAQSITDVVVGKMLNGGFAKLENGVLLSLIEIKNGKLMFNGKEIEFPKAKAAPAKAAAPAEAD